MEAGVDIFRLNMSHAPHDWVTKVVENVRRISTEINRQVGVLLDTQGPAIRTGDLPAKLDLKPGDIFDFTVRGEKSEDVHSVDVNYEGLVNDIAVGDTVLVDNGVMHMKVLEKHAHRIRCQVLTPGTLGSRRHINLPGVRVNLPPLTDKDLADIELGVKIGVDFVALSFCREASDVEALRKVLNDYGSTAKIIAKIEDQSAVKEIDHIIQATDAVMVARGDLGIECPMEELPIIQRAIIKRCITHGRPVIVATHMLESMIENPLPTRAEITDVANAVFEQADAIMLSGETTVGKYPVECVKILDRVARRIERSGGAGYASLAITESYRHKTMKSAVVLANSIPGSHLVVFTKTGRNAALIAHLRPDRAPIYAFSEHEDTCKQMTLLRGVLPMHMVMDDDPVTTVTKAENILKERSLVKEGDQLVVVSDLIVKNDRVDSIQLRHVH